MADLVRERRWIVFKSDDLPYPVAMSIGIGDDRRLRCTGLFLGIPPDGEAVEITSASLRDVPVGALLQELAAREREFRDFVGYSGPHGASPFFDPGLAEELPPPPPRVRGSLTREHLEYVAVEYRRALVETPRAPMQELRRRLGLWRGREIPEPTARRWVQRARDSGLLGESQPGKAGERPRRKDRE
ncbi:hypothetical protein [Actinomadura sp. 3N407]|uniref:hypothetical protein n=1 Tax=Actinomadura sp. 3N407 TaxID=3457423 RepID=UPI003FCE708A